MDASEYELWQGGLYVVHGEPAQLVFAELDRMLSGIPERLQVLADLRRFLAGREGIQLRSFAADPLALRLFVQLSLASNFGTGIVLRWPGVFWQIVQEREFAQGWGRHLLCQELDSSVKRLRSEPHQIRALIDFQHQHLLRIMLGDLADELKLPAIVLGLSDLTDAIIRAALDLARVQVTERHGSCDVPFAVLALGKYGARELNYSSDIDLIFLSGETDEASYNWLCRLAKALIAIIDTHHDTGRLYRVDMRLRPHGASGSLVISRREALDYYYTVGRAWERQAFIKARPVAGDFALADDFLAELTPWIHPRYLPPEALAEARLMRRRIEERARRADVKAGSGGIRDIEFLVQSYQVSHGGRLPELRARSTLQALDRLARVGLISEADRQELERAYTWLRMVEHRLQLWQARQMHELPDTEAELTRLAWRCGYQGPDRLERFLSELDRTRERVRTLAQRHYLDHDSARDGLLALISAEEADVPKLAKIVLSTHRFKNLERAGRRIRHLATEPFFLLSRARTEQAFLDLAPTLLKHLDASPNPDAALERFSSLIDGVGGRSVFFSLLAKNLGALEFFVNLSTKAMMPIELLRRHPGLSDELIDHLRLPPISSQAFSQELAALSRGLDTGVQPLAAAYARETILTIARDLDGQDLATSSTHLTMIAKAMLAALLDRATCRQMQICGPARRPDGSPSRFAIIALGKLGAGILSYASDLDLIFVCDAGGQCQGSDLDSETAWERTAQELMRLAPEAGLAELDLRLRPWGHQGALVPSLETLRGYWQSKREIWERMAMTRARFIAGEETLGQEICAIIHSGAWKSADILQEFPAIRAMRQRLEQSSEGPQDFKRGSGGTIDIEFLAQALALKHLTPDQAAGRSTTEVLQVLRQSGILCKEYADSLITDLTLLRRIEARLRLFDGRALSSLPKDPETRNAFAHSAGYETLSALDEALNAARQRIRAIFQEVLAGPVALPHRA